MNKTVRVKGSELLKTIIKRLQHTPSNFMLFVTNIVTINTSGVEFIKFFSI
jgi:hypothetical protein